MARSIFEQQALSLEATNKQVDDLEKTINDLQIHTRRFDMYPFDTVAGEMLCKAFALSRCVMQLIKAGYPDEAFGLCRSLYECAVYLRYITSSLRDRDDRSRKFLEFGLTSKAFWFDLLKSSSNLTVEERGDIERYKIENGIPDDPRRIMKPWSEVWKLVEQASNAPHPTDADTSNEAFRERQRAIAYTDTSCYVHCTQPGLNSYSFDWKESIQIRQSKDISTRTSAKACMLVRVHLQDVVRYCLFGMGVVSLHDLKSRERRLQIRTHEEIDSTPATSGSGHQSSF